MIIALIILFIILIGSFVVEWKTFDYALRGRYIGINMLAGFMCAISGFLIIVVGLIAIYTALG